MARLASGSVAGKALRLGFARSATIRVIAFGMIVGCLAWLNIYLLKWMSLWLLFPSRHLPFIVRLGMVRAEGVILDIELGYVATAAIALTAVWLATRFIDGRPLSSAGLTRRGALSQTAAGVVITSSFVTLLQLFWIAPEHGHLAQTTHGMGVALLCLKLLFNAFAEEIAYRGYILRTVEASAGTVGAAIVSAVLFGIIHVWDMPLNLDFFLRFALTASFAFFLAGAYVWTRRLWLPIGLHCGWDFGWMLLWPVRQNGAVHTIFALLAGGVHFPASDPVVYVAFYAAAYMMFRADRTHSRKPALRDAP
jgi:membrane protease YdiL (CAAX protease family)